MKRLFISAVALFLFSVADAQNIGIGTTTPRAKLHIFRGPSGYNGLPYFPLIVENNAHTYVSLLSPDANETGILFGNSTDAASGGIIYNNINTLKGLEFRTNGNLTQMVITTNGDVGIGEIFPGATFEVARGTSPGGTAILRGTTHASQFNYSMNEDTYIRAGKDNRFVILNDIPGGRVGIGTNNPNAPLGFAAVLGKKISLFPGATGDAGLTVQSSGIQIHAQQSNADIAFGYDQGGVFFERFRMRGNGSFSINGNSGAIGQVLQSNGNGVPPVWGNSTNQLYYSTIVLPFNTYTPLTSNTPVSLPGLSHTYVAQSNTKLFITFTIPVNSPSCFACGPSDIYIEIYLDGALSKRFHQDVPNDQQTLFNGSALLQLAPGTHTISFSAYRGFTNAGIGDSFNASHVVLQYIRE